MIVGYKSTEDKRINNRLYYSRNREKVLKRLKEKRKDKVYVKKRAKMSLEWSRANPLKILVIKAKCRAKRNNIKFNLDPTDLKMPKYCPVLGIKLKANRGGYARDESPSLDRINNSCGYTRCNTQIISYLANSMKRNATKEQLIKFAKWVLRNTSRY